MKESQEKYSIWAPDASEFLINVSSFQPSQLIDNDVDFRIVPMDIQSVLTTGDLKYYGYATVSNNALLSTGAGSSLHSSYVDETNHYFEGEITRKNGFTDYFEMLTGCLSQPSLWNNSSTTILPSIQPYMTQICVTAHFLKKIQETYSHLDTTVTLTISSLGTNVADIQYAGLLGNFFTRAGIDVHAIIFEWKY